MAAPETAAPPPAMSEEAAESDAPACRNCGATLAGEFCHECGERRPDGRRDLSLRHFAGEAAQEFASLEHSKLLRTLGALLLFFAARTFYGGGVGRNVFRALALVFGFTLISVLAYFLTYTAALYVVTLGGGA